MRVLIVDDEQAFAEPLAQRLELRGIEAAVAGDAETALGMLSRQEWDLVFLDVCLPGMDGVSLLKLLQEHEPRPDVVMLSGATEMSQAVKAMRRGALNWLAKPVSLDAVLEECRKVGHEDRALMFCSLSKVTFPGAGVAAMAASRRNIDYILKNMFPMIISFDKLNQVRHIRFLKDMDGLAAHMEKHRALLEPKFRAVLAILDEGLSGCGSIARWTKPNGGYFLSLYTLGGCAKRTVQLCREAGVVLTDAGAAYPYGVDPQDSNIRIAPSLPPVEDLEKAMEVFCVCLRMAALEQLLQE